MECKFCKSTLKTVSSLNYHLKNNKKCLEIQEKVTGEVNSALVKCEFCDKNYSMSNIGNHVKNCKTKKVDVYEKLQNDYNNLQTEYEKKIQEVQDLKEYIIKLETENSIYKKDHDTISDIAKQPKNTINNNTINNLSIYDDNEIKNRFSIALNNIKPSDLYDGQKSIGRVVAPCLKNDDGTKMITCTDYSRNIFMYKDKNGNINKDIKCKNLAELIEPLASAKAGELMKEDYHNKTKSLRLLNLQKQISQREKEINELDRHLLGLEKDSKAWDNTFSIIRQKYSENRKNRIEIEELENEGITCADEYIYSTKLVDAADDIKEMQKDSTKFSKTLSELV